MAQKLNSVTPDSKPPDIANPDGSYLDKNEPTVVGSPTLAGIANSIYSFFSACMVFADISYSGLVDTTTVSQYFQALTSVINTKITEITDPLTVKVTDNENDINTLSNSINTNSGEITTLENKTPQSYRTTDSVIFDSVNTGYGGNDVVPEDVYFDEITVHLPDPTIYTLPVIAIKQTCHIKLVLNGLGAREISLPSGVYSYTVSYLAANKFNCKSFASLSGSLGSYPGTTSSGGQALFTYRRIS